ncbi:unnamed protein product [Cylindrotheca closterium]|uniref:Orc1-like AAA ATPase domain-containing protein n=1 Tax=Cylindrotheca closterium TaxID=2856 RepID=A0AAD2G059_9STRA|nr:unnamed protein product [Cylindrotheca closterium]
MCNGSNSKGSESSRTSKTQKSSDASKGSHQASRTTANSQSSKQKQNELGIKMAQLGLFGRNSEIKVIRKCLDDVVATGKNKLLCISGLSGTGKTALAATVANAVAKKKGIFSMGKFDQKLRGEPYAGIAAAGRHICGEILHLKHSNEHMGSLSFEGIQETIIKELGPELATLVLILPEIEDIVGTSSEFLAQDDGQGGNNGGNKERLNGAIRTFFRTVASFFKPLVMVLDDIQWADLPSIDLMEVLMTDNLSTNFMLIALYRSNEVDDTHIVSKFIRTLDEKEDEYDYDTTKIEVGDLKVEQIEEILANLLHIPSYRTSDLAEIVHRRTGGNAFFVINFIDMLSNEKLIAYSRAEKSWVWDENQIELETIATDNVVSLLKEKMKSLPSKMQEILQLAACLGASFREEFLSKVVKDYFKESPMKPSELSEWLTKAVTQGFLNIDSVGYKWVHDKVQEAALFITSEQDLQTMRYEVGTILRRRLSRQELDKTLFVVVNLLNIGIGGSMSLAVATSLAELNFRAARRAMRLSGFEIASNYAGVGIGLLPQDCWQSHHDLTLKLYALATNAYGVLGNVETMQVMYDEVLNQPNLSLEERFPLYVSMIESLSGRDVQAAKDLCYDVLEQFNHPLLRGGRKLAIYTRLNLIKKYDKNLDPNLASTLPEMTDKTALAVMKVLSTLLVLVYVSDKRELPQVTLKMVALVNEFGVCDEAANGYAYRGGMASNLKVIDAYAKFTQTVMERSKDRYSKAATKMYLGCLQSFTHDIRSVQKGYYENYHYSSQVGDIQMSLYSFMMVLYYELVSGRSLRAAADETRETIRNIKSMNRGWQVHLMSIMFQVILNMQGQSEDPLVLKGEAIDEALLDPEASGGLDYTLLHGFKGIIFTFCGNHRANAEETLEKMPFLVDAISGNAIAFWFQIYVAISCLHCARSCGKRSSKYRRYGKETSKKTKTWIAQGCPNLKQLDLLMDAELAVLANDPAKACRVYRRSVEVGKKVHRPNDAGLASERLGEFLLSINDKDGAKAALLEAMDLYSLWESDYKVESIRSKHEELLRPVSVLRQD